ncbi:hypothetical protein CPB83DRAFT_891184 [Crepidotus variabilis]|uniref:Uncharacterized protein n=1 Tax=Crepidotus variabilis TaxID=179855 RepID=A0A9P6EN40_9AGAR|nr:hypothetical protein CPB83DRAFT_891184 [Crepidotus variabilis]
MFTIKYIFLVFAISSSLVAAAPLGDGSARDNIEIREPMKNFAQFARVARTVRRLTPPHNGAVFWSGTKTKPNGKTVSVKADAQKFAHSVGGRTINQALKKKGITIPNNNKYSPRLWNIASKAYAKNARGQAHAVLGGKVRDGSVWKKIEKPTLRKNRRVGKITEHNMQTGQKSVTHQKRITPVNRKKKEVQIRASKQARVIKNKQASIKSKRVTSSRKK